MKRKVIYSRAYVNCPCLNYYIYIFLKLRRVRLEFVFYDIVRMTDETRSFSRATSTSVDRHNKTKVY